ncbi:RNA polymerase sigma factor [Mariniluteicoccus flavus]
MTDALLEPEDEAELLERAREGDQQAFAALVTPYRNRTWAVCLRMTDNHTDAEDALQEAMTAAWRNLDKFRGDARFGTWLYRIAVNSANALTRKRRERPTDIEEWQALANEVDPYDQLIDNQRLKDAIAGLPEHYREALVLREVAQLSYEEVAAHLRIPVQTVKSRLNRARKQAAEALGPDFGGQDARRS